MISNALVLLFISLSSLAVRGDLTNRTRRCFSFIDLPNISASIYSVELCNRLRAFLVACPPAGPSPPVADLIIATSDFQRDLVRWNMRYPPDAANSSAGGVM